MRIVQLIDNLNAGGAERIAVNLANILSEKNEFSGLVASRKEGSLKQSINANVNYSFLNRNKVFDIKALFSFKKYLKTNQVEYIHAHSSSFFLATLVKIIYPKIKLIWHDHYGYRIHDQKNLYFLKICSLFFHVIITVNKDLKAWSKKKLYCSKVFYLHNFVDFQKTKPITNLKGNSEKRIIILANWRPQKNLEFLIEIIQRITFSFPDWTFHSVGMQFNDEYQQIIEKKITDYQLKSKLFVYGSCLDIENILSHAQIGILTSYSEGLPVSLLEYGYAKLPVVSTRVGEISSIIQDSVNGFLVESNDIDNFVKKLTELIKKPELRAKFGQTFNELINQQFTVEGFLEKYFKIING